MTSSPPETPVPQLSAALVSYAAEAPDGWETMLETARLYDRVGIDRLVVSDHVVFGEQLDAYGRPEVGGQLGGRQPTGPDGHWLEPMTVLSIVAGMTSRARLATGILLAALRRPVVLAKTAATLDVLSGGRLDLGVGVGWQREEYEAAGLDFDGRGRLLDHTLEVCTALWTQSVASYRSADLGFERIHMMPKPRAARRRTDLGERAHQRPGRRSTVPLRAAVDPVGRRCRRDRTLDPPDTGAHRRRGRLPRRLAGRHQPARLHHRRRRHRRRAHDRTGAASGHRGRDRPARAGRVRDVDDRIEAGLRELVAAFRTATGREPAP